jgi:hypothetical protein
MAISGNTRRGRKSRIYRKKTQNGFESEIAMHPAYLLTGAIMRWPAVVILLVFLLALGRCMNGV